MKILWQRLAKLVDVKSIISLLFAACLSIAFLRGDVEVKDYLTVCTMSLTFFFGYQTNKKPENDRKE